MKRSHLCLAAPLLVVAGWSTAASAQQAAPADPEPAEPQAGSAAAAPSSAPDEPVPDAESAAANEDPDDEGGDAQYASGELAESEAPSDLPSERNAVSGSARITLNAPPVAPPTQRAGYASDDYDDAPPLVEGNLWVGGYGGVTASHANFFGSHGALVGVEGAVLLNRRLAIGLSGYAFTNPAHAPQIDEIDRDLEVAYGGVTARYSFLFGSPLYLTVGGTVGPGAIVAAPRRESWGEDDFEDGWDDRYDEDEDVRREHVDVFTIVQPEATLHVNLTRWARLGVTAGYRAAFEVGKFGKEDSDVSGFVGGVSVQFGRF